MLSLPAISSVDIVSVLARHNILSGLLDSTKVVIFVLQGVSVGVVGGDKRSPPLLPSTLSSIDTTASALVGARGIFFHSIGVDEAALLM